jgi:hypothetical protein
MAVQTQGPREQAQNERYREVVELYRSGTAPTEIARTVGRSVPYVYKVLRRSRVFRRSQAKTPLVGGERIIRRLHQAGLGVTLLAHLLQVSPLAIYKSLGRYKPRRARKSTTDKASL